MLVWSVEIDDVDRRVVIAFCFGFWIRKQWLCAVPMFGKKSRGTRVKISGVKDGGLRMRGYAHRQGRENHPLCESTS